MVRQLTTQEFTGITDLFIEFNTGYGKREDKRSYIKKEDAEDYISRCKKEYILIMFEKYVIASVSLMDSSTTRNRKTPARLESLERCRKTNRWFNTEERTLKTICEWVLKLEEDLIAILPAPSDPQRNACNNRLRDMIVFAKSNTTFRVNRKEPVEIN